MVSKVLIALLPLLALSAAQIPDWQYTQELDEVNASFLLYWTVQPEAGDIVLQFKAARGTGYIYFGIDNAANTLTDVIIGGYNNNISLPFVYVSHLLLVVSIKQTKVIGLNIGHELNHQWRCPRCSCR